MDEGCYLHKSFCICHQVLTLATANILPFLPTGALPNLLPLLELRLSTEHRKHAPVSPAMPASNPSRQSAHPTPHSQTRSAVPDVHGYVNFVPIPINQACRGACAPSHGRLPPPETSCKQPSVISGWRDSHRCLLPGTICCVNARGQIQLKWFCNTHPWPYTPSRAYVASSVFCPQLFLALQQVSAPKMLSVPLLHIPVLPLPLEKALLVAICSAGYFLPPSIPYSAPPLRCIYITHLPGTTKWSTCKAR